jgi:hypothetical protein
VRKEADRLYNAGYRKASDVAREIFEEVEEQIGFFRKYMYCNESVRVIVDVLDTLKKKYIGEDINAPTNTEGGK